MNWSERDKLVNWHPYTQQKTAPDPITIVRGKNEFLYDDQGNEWIDAVSSWWVTIHGHSHPYIAEKIFEQLNTIEHSIFAGFTHPKSVELSERLLSLLGKPFSRCFYSDNGSTAVEVSIKMAVQYYYNTGRKRHKIIAFQGAYHGDTFGAMSAADRSAFSAPFDPMLFDVHHIPVPTKDNFEDVKSELESHLKEDNVAAFMFEPLLLGTAGMKMYTPEHLSELIKSCQNHDVLAIADEVFTGFGRVGTMFAIDQLEVKPDIICLSKGITGGTLALGMTICKEEIYEAFLSDDKMKTFFHGHSYTGNAVACSAAVANLDLFESEQTLKKVEQLTNWYLEIKPRFESIPRVKEVRVFGSVFAIELEVESGGYFSGVRDFLYNYYQKEHMLLRPLGNLVYLVPPYCLSKKSLNKVMDVIETSFEALDNEEK